MPQVFYLVNEAITQINLSYLVESIENCEERKGNDDDNHDDAQEASISRANFKELVNLICMGLLWLTELCSASTHAMVLQMQQQKPITLIHRMF